MEGLGPIAELAPEMCDVLYVGLLRERQATVFKATNAELHAVLAEDFDAKGPNVRSQFGQRYHFHWALRLECSFAGKHNHRVNLFGRDEVQELCDSRNVLAILMNRILELVVLLVEHLGPLRGRRVREQPPFVVLRFEYEDPKPRDQDVVDLRGAIFNGQRDVVEQVIARRGEVCNELATNCCFSAVLHLVLPKTARQEADAEANDGDDESGHLCDLTS